MRRLTHQHTSLPPLNVEVTFHTESTHEDSLKLSRSGYADDAKADAHTRVVSAV